MGLMPLAAAARNVAYMGATSNTIEIHSTAKGFGTFVLIPSLDLRANSLASISVGTIM